MSERSHKVWTRIAANNGFFDQEYFEQCIEEAFAQLEAENERMREGLTVLGGSPKDMLEYCQEHELLPKTGPDGLWEGHVQLSPEYSTERGWRKLIVDALTQQESET